MHILINTLFFLAAFCGIFFGYFRMLDARSNSNKREASKKQYAAWWAWLQEKGWHALFHTFLAKTVAINFLPSSKGYGKVSVKTILVAVSAIVLIPALYGPRDINRYTLLASLVFLVVVLIIAIRGLLVRRGKGRRAEQSTPAEKTEYVLAIVLSSSLILSSISLMLGHGNMLLRPNLQLLIANLICDFATIGATYLILKRIQATKLLGTISLISLDLMVAAILAFLSLYLGVLSTENQLASQEVLNILFFQLRDGSAYGIDPYFWIMHTTFIPTLLYLAVIFFLLIARHLTIPFMKLLKDASAADKPHYATATTFGFIGALCSGVAAFLTYVG